KGDDFPLGTLFRQAVRETYGSQRLPTQRLRRCEPNDTSRTRSRHCAYASASPSPADYRDAHAAQLQYTETYHAEISDAVVLGAGIEYSVTSNWSVKLEYDYMDFGSH